MMMATRMETPRKLDPIPWLVPSSSDSCSSGEGRRKPIDPPGDTSILGGASYRKNKEKEKDHEYYYEYEHEEKYEHEHEPEYEHEHEPEYEHEHEHEYEHEHEHEDEQEHERYEAEQEHERYEDEDEDEQERYEDEDEQERYEDEDEQEHERYEDEQEHEPETQILCKMSYDEVESNASSALDIESKLSALLAQEESHQFSAKLELSSHTPWKKTPLQPRNTPKPLCLLSADMWEFNRLDEEVALAEEEKPPSSEIAMLSGVIPENLRYQLIACQVQSSPDLSTQDSVTKKKKKKKKKKPTPEEPTPEVKNKEFSEDWTSLLTCPTPPKVESPISLEFHALQKDPGFRHALRAGYLWQTLAGKHVRFPKKWFDGARAPKMGADEIEINGKKVPRYPWVYIERCKIREDSRLKNAVHDRRAPGRLLLHIVVRDMATWVPVQDISIGVYHSNARGIRLTAEPSPGDEESHEVWMATRKRTNQVSVVEKILTRGRSIGAVGTFGPLGRKRQICNLNLRAVFGEEPPVHTLFLQEGELYEVLTMMNEKCDNSKSLAMQILKAFMEDW